MSIEAIKHYEAALLEAFPRGATGDVFEHWNKARIAIADLEKQEPVAWLYESPMPDGSVFVGASAERLSIGVAVTSETIEKPLYTTPPAAPKREPLTDAEFAYVWYQVTRRIMGTDKEILLHAKRITEAAHGIKEKNT